MRLTMRTAWAMLLVAATATWVLAQFDPDRKIAGGGVFVPGWTGKIDQASANQGRTLTDAKFVKEGDGYHITTGPATTYWNPANTIAGDYTVKARFTEPKFMELNSHPHSYGLFIGGHDLGGANMSLVYCVTYGDGTFLVRGFGPAVFTLQRTAPNAAVHKAPAVLQPVTQDIQWTVKGNRVECSINGTVVAGYNKPDLVAPGRLMSTDGVYGLRYTHNVEAVVSGFAATKN